MWNGLPNGPLQDRSGQASVMSAALGNTAKGAHAPTATGRNRILVVPRWGEHTFGNLPQGGARCTRLPWADLLSTFGAGGVASKGAHAPTATGQNRILVGPRWGEYTFGNLSQGGARDTRLPWADLLSTFGAGGVASKGAHAPTATGQNRILVVPRWGEHTFGNLSQGGGRYTRLPWADLLSTFGAGGCLAQKSITRSNVRATSNRTRRCVAPGSGKMRLIPTVASWTTLQPRTPQVRT